MAIAFHKNCPFVLEDHLVESQGRFVMVKSSLYANLITFVKVYAPNFGQVAFWMVYSRRYETSPMAP